MDLVEQIQKDMVQAMKAKEPARVSVLRMMKAALKYKEIEKKAKLSDEDAVQVLKTQLKQRVEAIEQFEKGGRADLAEKERREKAWIESYLPEPVSAGEIDAAVAGVIEELGAQGPKDMGAVMKGTMARLQTTGKTVDGKAVNARVRQRLQALTQDAAEETKWAPPISTVSKPLPVSTKPFNESMLKPPALKPSATVGVIAPASPVRAEFMERGLAELSRLGFRTRLGSSLYARSRFTAGDAEQRTADFVELWEDPEVAGIFCARGGYGSLDLLERLDPNRLKANPKILLGASDSTALLCFLAGQAGMVSFHGPMVAQQMARGDSAYDVENLLGILGNPEPAGRLPASVRVLHPGAAEGTLLGGCLSLVSALVGTPYLPSFSDAIVFLEDTAVKPYQIDRMLQQLRMAGHLDAVRGLVFGEMPNCEQHASQGYDLDEVLKDATRQLGVPVLSGFPSGHSVFPAQTLPFGVRARIDDDGLSLLEGAVV